VDDGHGRAVRADEPEEETLFYCGLTVLGAVMFLVIKFFEYKAKNDHGLFVFTNMFGGYDQATGSCRGSRTTGA
jgi:heme/copper-type cytochrome/quinol oxidase subunit 3